MTTSSPKEAPDLDKILIKVRFYPDIKFKPPTKHYPRPIEEYHDKILTEAKAAIAQHIAEATTNAYDEGYTDGIARGLEVGKAEVAEQVEAEKRQAVVDELEQLLTNINIAEGYKEEPNKELKWPNQLILDRLAELRSQHEPV